MTPRHLIKDCASFRDPAGYVFNNNGIIYRQVNNSFQQDFDFFISGGLYNELVNTNLLIGHEQLNDNLTGDENTYNTLKPEQIPFISYPCEWSFDMLKDAALLTVQIAKKAMQFGMMLKDATPYNIQLHKGKMIFIDTLSFERYDEAKPWIAYRQFCENFVAPLALMHYSNSALQQLFLAFPEGMPLNIVRKLLPGRSKWNLNMYLHVHLHGKISNQTNANQKEQKSFSVQKMKNILRSLEETISSFTLTGKSGVWSDYYAEANQRADYMTAKKMIITEWLNTLQLKTAIDVGANEGEFSELLFKKGIYTISVDFDHYSINQLYKRMKSEHITTLHPLVMDLSAPTPAIGLNNEERNSFLNRAKADLVLALALIHHLAIGKNIPFTGLADFFHRLANHLLIEFIPKEDEKIQFMLRQKKDIYVHYTENIFIAAFEKYFSIVKRQEVGNSGRVLYLLKKYE